MGRLGASGTDSIYTPAGVWDNTVFASSESTRPARGYGGPATPPTAPANETRAAVHPLYTSCIESIGARLPDHCVSTREIMRACGDLPRVDLERLTGIRERRVCGPGEDSYSLAVDAAWDCLSHSRHAPGDIDMIISCSISKYGSDLAYRFEPALSLSVKEAIGAGDAIHFDVSNACAGMLTGVMLLDSFIRSGSIRRGMVVSGEYISSISDNATREVRSLGNKQLASLTAGDAGSAVIVDRAEPSSPGISACEMVTHAEHSDLCIGEPAPHGPGAMMTTDAGKLHQQAIAHCAPPIRRALEQAGLRIDEIDYMIPHQTSARAIRAGSRHLERALGGAPGEVVQNLEAIGNTATTSHFIALDRLIREGRIAPEHKLLLLAFASGIVVGAVVFTAGELGEVRGRSH
jgi:3-oxoacyl-[acyl-carrier-protein] synthase-3